ncbi:unnamed protein product [Rangifer tarandus platyrhynchus]|uniref:Uncharacterized protein n=1 Tax=Rangifer tarandus platyrhynchus TaxID=3082113 RepID=A0AC59YZ10_RANTA
MLFLRQMGNYSHSTEEETSTEVLKCIGLIFHKTAEIMMAEKTGSLGNRECCSGALNQKVILGDMGRLGGTRLTKMRSSWRCGTAPGGCKKNGSSGLQIHPASGSRREG